MRDNFNKSEASISLNIASTEQTKAKNLMADALQKYETEKLNFFKAHFTDTLSDIEWKRSNFEMVDNMLKQITVLQACEEKRVEEKRAEEIQAEEKRAEEKRAEEKRAEENRKNVKKVEIMIKQIAVLQNWMNETKIREEKIAEEKIAEKKRAEEKRDKEKRAEEKRAEEKRAEEKRAEEKLAEEKRITRAWKFGFICAVFGIALTWFRNKNFEYSLIDVTAPIGYLEMH
jgi:hypothetical protein